MKGERHIRSILYAFVLFTMLLVILLLPGGCSDNNSVQPKTPIEPNLFNEKIDLVGYHCLCWDQRIGGELVQPGTYAVRMVAADYDWSEEFKISSASPEVPAWSCCDTSTVSIFAKMNVDPPKYFGFELSAAKYSPGDTVSIRLAIPAPAQVQLQVSRVE